MQDQTASQLAQQILDALATRKGTDQSGKLSILDIQKLKKIASM